MKLLVLTNSHDHPHDYGTDHLFYGLVQELGVDNVWDYPLKPNLHLMGPKDRDPCQIDSDQWLPLRANQDAPIAELAATADAVLLTMSPDDEPSLRRAQDICLQVPAATPIGALDTTDYVRDLRGVYALAAGRPLAAYFKREMPLGADWGVPCPLSYPAGRVGPLPPKRPRVFYRASAHTLNGGGPGPAGQPRVVIVEALRKMLPASMRDVGLFASREEALTPEEYHQRMAEALVGVSWNGAINWDTNRFWEHFAYGLAQVAERPRIQLPNAPEHMRHCYYVDQPEQIGPVVTSMVVRNRLWAIELAASGHAHWKKHHSSEARARQVLERLIP